jgi:uncharacterized protein YkuJ
MRKLMVELLQQLERMFGETNDLQPNDQFMANGEAFVFVEYGHENAHGIRAIKCHKVGKPKEYYYVSELEVIR